MDVFSLYPNIDHEEGISACEEQLEKQLNKSVPTTILTNLLRFILQCNIIQFGKRFFHQIKGTAMGTPMAVNYASIFMGKFEKDMLNEYRKKFLKSPSIWLRYIDDIFFTWDYDEASLKHFFQFCNVYASNNKMLSSLKFTTHYSR